MKARIFLVLMIILAAILAVSNILSIITSPIQTLINLGLLGGIITLAVMYGERKEKESYDYEYDYDQENPNALISGKPVGGTVYASYPNATPGLGWIL